MAASVCSEILITNPLNFVLPAGVWHEKDESLMSVSVYTGPFLHLSSAVATCIFLTTFLKNVPMVPGACSAMKLMNFLNGIVLASVWHD